MSVKSTSVTDTAMTSDPSINTRPLRPTTTSDIDGPALLEQPPLRRLLDILNPAGEETRVVGGAVRNALLGLRPGDIDLATTMLPAEVVRRAKAAKLRSIPTGIAHGTVTVLCAGRPFEVTTLREDIETDGRRAVVRFGRDFALDAQRRDFTMNALSFGLDGRLHDPVGGLDDLASGRVRFIGDAATRIREDYLRILRFFRFHALHGSGSLDPEGIEAATANRDGLRHLSRERVRAEMLKILAAAGAVGALASMRDAGILHLVLGGPASVEALERLVAFAPADADPILKLAALTGNEPSDTKRLRDLLRLTNAETKRLDAASRAKFDFSRLTGHLDEATLLRWLVVHGRDASADAIRLRAAATAPGPAWQRALAFVGNTTIPVLPIGGDDLLRRGLRGPAIGIALGRLRDLWAEAGFPADTAALEALLQRVLDDGPSDRPSADPP